MCFGYGGNGLEGSRVCVVILVNDMRLLFLDFGCSAERAKFWLRPRADAH